MSNQKPLSIDFFSAIKEQFPQIESLFDPKTESFKELKEILKSSTPINENELFISNKNYIVWSQLMYLMSISMYGGIFLNNFHHITYKKDVFKLNWDGHIREEFTFGKSDQKYTDFYSYLQKRVFGKTSNIKDIDASFVKHVFHIIQGYFNTIQKTNDYINLLLKNETNLADTFDGDINSDILFVLLSCCSSEQINALFLHVQQFFPSDLVIKDSKGSKININAVFQNPSVDLSYLLTKVNIYFDLFYSSKFPIIKHITRTKTKDYFKKLLQNKKNKDEIILNLNGIKNTQITPRINLYTVFIKQIQFLLN